jgi:hypothetical protein
MAITEFKTRVPGRSRADDFGGALSRRSEVNGQDGEAAFQG